MGEKIEERIKAEDRLKEKVKLEMTALEWLAVHGNVCIGLRHPRNRGPSRSLAEKFLHLTEREFLEMGILSQLGIQRIHKIENDAQTVSGIAEQPMKEESPRFIGIKQITKLNILDFLRMEVFKLRRAQKEGTTPIDVQVKFKEEMDIIRMIEEVETIPTKHD